MIKHWVFLIGVLLAGWNSTSLADNLCAKKRPLPAPQALVDQVQQEYQKLSGFTAQFKQRAYLRALELTEESKGSVNYLAPGNLRFDYVAPEKQVFILSKGYSLLYQEFDKQMVRQPLEQVLISELPVAFLAGVGKLSDSFEVISACQRAADRVILFKPKKDKNLVSFALIIATANALPIGARTEDVNGNSNHITLHQPKYQAPEAKIFDFVPPKGTDVIEH